MPRPSQRTRSSKKRNVKVPGGRVETKHSGKRHSQPRCRLCGRPLSGFKTTPSEARKISHSERTVARPFGGNLCSRCLRIMLKEAVRLG